MNKKTLLVVVGPTAVGKTAFCIDLAQRLHTEIISADSRQFYKEIPIGTAAPTAEELAMVPHHFVGNLSIVDYYNVSIYEQEALKTIEQLFQTKDIVIATGGSGLYIDTLCNGIDNLPDVDVDLRKHLQKQYETEGLMPILNQLQTLDPEYYQIVDKNNYKRVLRAVEVCLQTGKTYTELRTQPALQRKFRILKICLALPREILNERINLRTEMMLKSGMIEEAEALLPMRNLNALNTVGYKELFACFDGKFTLAEAKEKIKTNTRRYAKRQMTWFKRDEKMLYFSPAQIEDVYNWVMQNTELQQVEK
ncbi:MAG: tRNA (adenosine(37)-N6)-dimethylallyltransferase MiaA [Bacteroidales bacterium]|nr:tRNA (adenosine(37)-N6)-dimethylallyltransferase MiaA [Bacteroidales bacterium]